jgi:hypothetical protein
MREQFNHPNIIPGQPSKDILREMGRRVITQENRRRPRQFDLSSDGFDHLDENRLDIIIRNILGH